MPWWHGGRKEIDYTGILVYNTLMNTKTCNVNPLAKYIRIILSLTVIGLGIYYQNWLGILGLLTLYTAITGKCNASLRFPRKRPVISPPPEPPGTHDTPPTS